MIRLALVSGALSLAAAASLAAEPPGALSCSGCHALRGEASRDEASAGIPPVLSKSADEIAAAMLAYRAGEGSPTVMDRISKGFTEEEIRAIAAWIASRG